MMANIVIVVEERVSTEMTAHHDSTGICAASSLSTSCLSPVTSISIAAKLCTSATLPNVSEARSASSE
jgi:hypothetical protein